MPAAIQNASLFSCQRTLCPARPDRPIPDGTFARLFFKRGRNNKKPGIERRAKPSTQPDGFARCSIICYPEFVTDLSSGGYSETLIAPDNHSYSSDESRVYQNHSIRQALLLQIYDKTVNFYRPGGGIA
jgi:hypothetical protein